MAVNELIRQAIQCPRERPRYAYIAPLYKQAKDIAWDYLRHYAGVIPGTTFNESELRADLPNGARIRLLGAENADTLRGIYLDGAVLDEYAYMPPDVWPAVIRPALADRPGFAVFLGTPLGRNHFFQLYEKARAREHETTDTVTMLARASETGVLSAEELEAARRDMTPELYQQEFECSFEAAILGAYYARELETARADGRITRFGVETHLPVETYWDLGWDDSTTILFVQRLGREIRIIDTLDNRQKDLAWYAQQLRNKPYLYHRHYLPHDAEVTELGSGRTRLSFLQEFGIQPLTVLGKNEPADGIEQARRIFPRLWFREPQTTPLRRIARSGTRRSRCSRTSRCTIGRRITRMRFATWRSRRAT